MGYSYVMVGLKKGECMPGPDDLVFTVTMFASPVMLAVFAVIIPAVAAKLALRVIKLIPGA